MIVTSDCRSPKMAPISVDLSAPPARARVTCDAPWAIARMVYAAISTLIVLALDEVHDAHGRRRPRRRLLRFARP
jgi:hypothetical protein